MRPRVFGLPHSRFILRLSWKFKCIGVIRIVSIQIFLIKLPLFQNLIGASVSEDYFRIIKQVESPIGSAGDPCWDWWTRCSGIHPNNLNGYRYRSSINDPQSRWRVRHNHTGLGTQHAK